MCRLEGPRATGDAVTPEHSHICVCEACAPKNRGLLERLIAEHDALIACGFAVVLSACSSSSERPPPAQDCETNCIGFARDAGFDAADASDASSDGGNK